MTDQGNEHESIGARLRRMRQARSQSQRAFAEAMDMPLPSYRDYEGGKRIPGGEALRRLAGVGIDTHWLLTGENLTAPAAGPAMAHDTRGTYRTPGADEDAPGPLCTRRLTEVLTAIETALEDIDRRLPPARKAELAAALYDLYEETGKAPTRRTLERFIRSAS